MVGFTIRGTDSRPVTDVTFVPVIRTALWTVRTKNVIIVSFYTLRLVFFLPQTLELYKSSIFTFAKALIPYYFEII